MLDAKMIDNYLLIHPKDILYIHHSFSYLDDSWFYSYMISHINIDP